MFLKKSFFVALLHQNWRIQSSGPNVSESTKVHIVVLFGYIISFLFFLPKTDLHCSAGFHISANTEESNEADKNLFRLTPYGALPDW